MMPIIITQQQQTSQAAKRQTPIQRTNFRVL